MSLGIPEAIEAFARGFALTRSFTHPYDVIRVGPLWVMRDAPRKSGDYRSEEILVHGLPPRAAVNLVQKYGPGRHAICAVEPEETDYEAQKLAYRECGYRLLRREPLFVRGLDEVPTQVDDRIRRVTTQGEADQVTKAAGGRQILPQHLGSDASPVRLYAAWVDGIPVGWVKSVVAGGGLRWVSNLYVAESHRRQRLASGLMYAMLRDDRRLGDLYSLLLASNAGSKLYPTLGYEQIALLQLYVPLKKRTGLP